MKPHLMFAEDDSTPRPPVNAPDLIADLELATLCEAMARGDEGLLSAARAALLDPLTDPAEIRYRQQVLADCLRHPGAVRELHRVADEAIAAERKLLRGAFTGQSAPLLNRSVRVLEVFGDFLHRLRAIAERQVDTFSSSAFTRLFREILAELDDDYLRTMDAVLEQLRFEHGIVVSARLGDGNKGVDFVLRKPPGKGRKSPGHRALKRSNLSFTVTGRDESDYRSLTALRGRALSGIANATAQSADHVRDFFLALRDELGFYLGCVNLAETLSELGVPTCWPEPRAPGGNVLSARELHEPCLALRLRRGVVGSDLDADGRSLVLITGPNQGGKSTFLRGAGIAHLMMQAGMFVAARQFTASTVTGVFTHYKREEDASMASGKLDEELARMSTIADHVTPGSLLLCNESFASTNEREGADIAAEIVRALTDSGVRIVFVTHLYELARRMHTEAPERCVFLRATRRDDGERTFRISPGEPTPTAHGADLYVKIFGTAPVRSTQDEGPDEPDRAPPPW
ncbi:MutS-related protein [Amycolatopsis anabasis]|uniref:MutS-related protein n=1 Tax=Amycolatopsis anabasis TaxID=1840409 RepID=UPI001C555E3C|nr:hypothetical protein [Amycolatopsis anabasis]